MYRQAASKDQPARKGMAEALDSLESHETQPERPCQDDGHHHGYSYDPKNDCHRRNSPETLSRSWEHQQWNQRFARPENQDREQNPRGKVFLSLVVWVCVIAAMRMLVFVLVASNMGVAVRVRLV